ncbi:hypothetical protein NECAME_17248 [Necator americanus]|uniref:Protein kinase domain-containing protein n=1 Tax=Necator americanus TaxID=51031 RepID=W2TSL3_NECAM|nr:hypothetical protein NECAME_17248 [Necator americanus]ETN84111.1 hypothetical protein NECAME_17248 [Necator americanus]
MGGNGAAAMVSSMSCPINSVGLDSSRNESADPALPSFVSHWLLVKVHSGRASSGRSVAVKCARDAKEIQAARKEVEFYRRCAGARNIVKYVGSQHKEATDHSPERFSFAMERALFSLDKLMKQVRHVHGLPKDIIIDLLVDSASALNTLKSRGIAHRDIKHLNILVFPGARKGRRSQYLFKFCDMGVSSFVHEGGVMQTLVGTPHALPYIYGETFNVDCKTVRYDSVRVSV